MRTKKSFAAGVGVCAASIVWCLSGCSGMSSQDKSTAVGAGIGAVGGAVLTGGSAAGTVAGALSLSSIRPQGDHDA